MRKFRSQYEVLTGVLQQIADMAIRLEDEPSLWLGKSYSVNINFRRDGQRLYISIESYGMEHAGRSEEYIVPLLRKRRARTRAIIAGCAAGALLIAGTVLMTLK